MGKNHTVPNKKDSELVTATANSSLKEIEQLLSEGANPSRDVRGSTALHEAARLGLVKPAEILIEHTKDLDILDKDELTPLIVACSLGKAKGSRIASLLIEAGANPHYTRDDGMNALMFAVKNATSELVEQLLKVGAEVDGAINADLTPLMLAARANRVDNLTILIENGANPNKICKLPWAEGKTALEIAELEGRKKAVSYLKGVTK